MTYNELVAKIQAVLPEASFGEDLDGQVVIYTNLTQANKDDNATLEPLTIPNDSHQSCGAV